ncbi:MAG: hypothetical protein GY859_26140 [Desulfobacterales bacterium]|nr:hypothetical protein [Desulfobacterales bacterium]
MNTNQNKKQITAYVSEGTLSKLDRFSQARGVRKAFVMEQALLYHFRAFNELPEEAFLPPRLVFARDSFENVVDLVNDPPAPTKAMQELMNGISDKNVTEE